MCYVPALISVVVKLLFDVANEEGKETCEDEVHDKSSVFPLCLIASLTKSQSCPSPADDVDNKVDRHDDVRLVNSMLIGTPSRV